MNPLLLIPSLIFRLIVFIRNKLFDWNILKSYKTKAKVISIGNLAVGGTGKTPFVIFLANHLTSKGFVVGIVGRGYGRKSNKATIVYDGENFNDNPDESGDEMILIAKSTNCITLAHDKKWEAAIMIEKKFDLDIIIVDDGFQHRWLKRDLDICLLKNEEISKPYLMPMGRLREPLKNMSRSHLVGRFKEAWTEKLQQKADLAVTFTYDEGFGKPYNIFTNEEVNDLSLKYVLCSAIANNDSFFKTMHEFGYKIAKHLKFKDHYNYKEDDAYFLIQEALDLDSIVLVTEKDAVKPKSI